MQAAGQSSSTITTSAKIPPSEDELEWSLRGCLQRIETTLFELERSAPAAYGDSRLAVQIEVEKELGESRHFSGRPNPWVVLSMARKKQDTSQSTYDSWIPSNQEMYGSIAAGAVESLAGDEDDHIAALQAESDATAQIMRENLNRIFQRGERLDTLQDQNANLRRASAGFENRHLGGVILGTLRYGNPCRRQLL